MNYREARLQAKVAAVNNAFTHAAEWHPKLSEVFKPFVGQKLEKADGQFLAKIQKLVPGLPNSVRFSVYRHISNYSLAYVVKTCEMVPEEHGCEYFEVVMYVGKMQNGVLTALEPAPNGRTDWTAEEVKEKQATLRKAKEMVSTAQGELYPFGEYD
jgi:hypothetical protein